MNNNERPDIFTDLIRNKLEDHRLPVDSDCWDNIESHFKPKNKHRRIIGWVGSSVAAAAVIILLLFSLPENNSPSDITSTTPKADTTEVYNKVLDQKNVAESKDDSESNIISIPKIKEEPQKALSSTSKPEQKNGEAIYVALDDSINLANVDKDEAPANVPGIKTDSVAPTYIAQEAIEKEESKKAEPKRTIQEERIILPKTKSDSKWLLAANVSSGNFKMSSGNDKDMAYHYNSMSGVYAQISPDLSSSDPVETANVALKNSIEEIDDMDHSLPLSFGISVRKNINDRIGIETGLVYTYLSSKFKKVGQSNYQAKQELHYLGIPLNMVVYLWKDPKWNIYVSGGGTVEKGVRYKYTEKKSNENNFVADINDKGSVDGVQWSVNGSIGAAYSLTDNWGLYVEPQVSHYFDNNQPASIRTDKKTVFELSAGLRYEF
ncbi:MAG: porin family protein [Dysgonomonas sp.]|nr:porin family protein [Dysgonomonas sp.]